jgi:hypothetical protein
MDIKELCSQDIASALDNITEAQLTQGNMITEMHSLLINGYSATQIKRATDMSVTIADIVYYMKKTKYLILVVLAILFGGSLKSIFEIVKNF